MHTLKPCPATPRGWSGGSTAIYFFAGEGRVGASADIGANRSERKKTQDDKCCASHISTGRALCGRSLRHPPRSPMRTKPPLQRWLRMTGLGSQQQCPKSKPLQIAEKAGQKKGANKWRLVGDNPSLGIKNVSFFCDHKVNETTEYCANNPGIARQET